MSSGYTHLRIGLMGPGLEAYWEQFEGLKAMLEIQLAEVERRVSTSSRRTFSPGLTDTPQKAIEAGHAVDATTLTSFWST